MTCGACRKKSGKVVRSGTALALLNLIRRGVRRREGLLLIAFLGLATWFQVASDGIFFSPRNLALLLRQATIVGIVSAGVLILIIHAEIDLSIGSAVYLVSVIVAKLQVDQGWSTPAVVLAALAVGMGLGAWHGLWVTRLGVPSFIVTLAGLLAFRGIGLLMTDANTIAPVQASLINLSEGFIPIAASQVIVIGASLLLGAGMVQRYRNDEDEQAGRARAQLALSLAGIALVSGLFLWVVTGFQGIPMAVVFLAVVIASLSLAMKWTVFGRYAYVVGSNREAARRAGISTHRQIIRAFVVMGALYGLGGVLVTARLAASTPSTGVYLELDAIAAAVLGGAHLLGGRGAVYQALVGALLLATIDNGMSLLNVSSFLQLVVKGGILLAALASEKLD